LPRPRIRNFVRIITAALVAQVWLVGLGGCSRSRHAPREQRPPTTVEDPVQITRTRELRVQVDHIPSQLNQLVSLDTWCQWITLNTIVEPLVQTTTKGTFQPHLAAQMEVRGGRHFIFHLRRNVTFHDGRPLTSTDVKYTLDKLIGRNPPSELLKIELADIEEVRAPNEQTIELVLRRPNQLLPAVLSEIGILPAHLYGRFGLRNPKLNWLPVGTGPFRAADRRDKDSVLLERYDKYWGQAPRVSRILFRAIPGPARALSALRNDDLDILPSLYPGYYPEQVAAQRLKERYRVLRIHPYVARLMLFNHRNKVLKDRRVRLALGRLADRDRMIRTVRHDLGQVLSAPLWPLSRWYDASIHPSAYDRPGALRLLEAAGWTDAKADSRRQRAGKALRLHLLRSRESPEMEQLAQMLKLDLRGAGIEVDIQVADFGFIKTQLRRGRFELALVGIAPRPEADLSPLLHSKGELNYGGYSNPMVDAQLESMRSASSPEERQRAAQRLHRLLHEDPPFTVLYAPIELMVVSRRVKGLANNGRWPRLSSLALE
jgi:peptide/nickel transport system substrate-binding protein